MTTNMMKRTTLVALFIAVLALFTLGGVSEASSATMSGAMPERPTVCVDGYVINHREIPVDGTKTEPPLEVMAIRYLLAEAGEAEAIETDVIYRAEVDSHGYFEFEKLPEGNWNFVLPLPTEWDSIVPPADRSTDVMPTRARTGATMLEEKEHDGCYRIVFKIRRLIDVPVKKWEELQDGTVQDGEDWEITFEPQGDPFVKKQTEVTDQNGFAYFTVTPGEWKISEKVKKGWMPITPPEVYLTLDQYEPTGAREKVVFKNMSPICYGSIVVEKRGLGRDAQGSLVPLGLLAGWDITLSRADGAMHPVTKQTDASGQVVFDHLKPGVYEVEEHVQKGWKPVSENPQIVVIQDCEETPVVFENEEITGELSIHGVKLFMAWEKPYKGVRVGLSGWGITATLKGTDIHTTATTNALGEFWFTENQLRSAGMAVPGATITVCEEQRDNWIPYTPECVDVMFPYPVPPHYEGEYVKFVNYQDPPLPGSGMGYTAGASMEACQMMHVVQPGENLYRISLGYGTTVAALVQGNGIANPDYIRAGDAICVQ